jgi:hypothetical protein
MLIKKLIWIPLFILFFACPSGAQSSATQQNFIKPVPEQERATTSGPAKIGQQDHKTTNQNNPPNQQITGLDKIKPVIDNSKSNISSHYEQQNLEIQRQLSKFTSKIADFTLALVIVTAVLAGMALWQGYQLKRSVDSLRNAERAHIFVKVRLQDDKIKIIPGETPTQNLCEFIVMNEGKTPAILMNVKGFAGIFTQDDLPEIASITSDSKIPPGTVIIATIPNEKTFTAPFYITDEEEIYLYSASHRLFCMGCIQYRDIFGISHETGFCWEYQPRFTDFYPSNDYKRNYRT